MQKELTIKKDYSKVGEGISHEMAADFVNAHAKMTKEGVTSYVIGRNIIDEILAQQGCVGIRFYNALNENNQKTLVYVGIDADGKDIVKKVIVLEDGQLSTVPAIVADRSNWEGSLWDLIFGR
ncbi:MAG TPA: hypothetical protein VL727_10580 [Puia sp.]|jgi:hypothetical protein|nr:hypothetical protein [Puia sp.]